MPLNTLSQTLPGLANSMGQQAKSPFNIASPPPTLPANQVKAPSTGGINLPGFSGYKPPSGLNTGPNAPSGGFWDTAAGNSLSSNTPANANKVTPYSHNASPYAVNPPTTPTIATSPGGGYGGPVSGNPNFKPQVATPASNQVVAPQTSYNQNTSGGPIGAGTNGATDYSKNNSGMYAGGNGYNPNAIENKGPTQTLNNGQVVAAVNNQSGGSVQSPYISPTLPAIANAQANQANSPYNQMTGSAVGGLLNSQDLNKLYADRAQAITDKYAQTAAPILKNSLGQELGNATTGTSPVGEGNAAAIANATGNYLSGLSNQESQELSGNSQGLTAQGQAQSGLSSAAGASNTGQGLIQSALNQAAGTVAPSNVNLTLSPGQTAYNQMTGQTTGGMNPNVISSIVSGIKGGNGMTYEQAVNALGAYGNDPSAVSALRDSLQSNIPGYNIPQQAGAATGQQTVGATGGAIQSQQQTQVAGWQSALQQGQNLQSQFTDLLNTFGLNPSNINAVNTGLQAIAHNVSDPHYQALQNYVNDIANTYSQVLTPPGGSSTDTSRGIATSMLNASMQGQGLIQVMQQLDQAAKAKIAGVPTTGGGSGGGNGGVPNPWH